jgi:hypothetical protein
MLSAFLIPKERTVSNEESEVQKNDSKSNMGI